MFYLLNTFRIGVENFRGKKREEGGKKKKEERYSEFFSGLKLGIGTSEFF